MHIAAVQVILTYTKAPLLPRKVNSTDMGWLDGIWIEEIKKDEKE